MKNLIDLINVSKYYNKGKRNEYLVLDSINLKIEIGEMISIMGKSGAGKTTLINLIGGLDKATSGKVIFGDVDLSKLREHEMANFRANHVGIVLQNFALLNEENVETNILLPTYFVNKKMGKVDIDEVLKLCKIPGFRKRKVKELSGGEMQRVAIARALITKPDIIIADEPTGSLDSEMSGEIMDLLKELNNQGATILIVTHDEEIARNCKRIINIKDGKISG